MTYHYGSTRAAGIIKSKTRKARSIISLATLGALFPLAFMPLAAAADSTNITFEPPTYTVGNINGQDGWSATGSAGNGCAQYDEGVVNNATPPTGFGSQSFRISNAVTSGCFGDQAFSKPLVNAVGEADSTNGTFTAGTKQNLFSTQFSIASAVPSAQQPGLAVSVSPDRGDGSRMSYLRFEDQSDGIEVFFDDVTGTTSPVNFNETKIATLDRSVPHTVKLTLQAVDGPSNDVVKVWIDNNLVHTGTSWENYYRYDTEASAEQSPRIIKTMLFRAGGTAVPDNASKGFLFDNLTTSSSSTTATVSKPSITFPSNNASLTSAQLTHVDWTDSTSSAGPDGSPIVYQYQAYSDANYTNLIYDSGPTLTTSQIATPNTPNGVYYLRVRAIDALGNQSSWSNDSNHPYKITVRDLVAPPTTFAQCANDGWKSFNNPSFRNRGQCMDYVRHHSHSIKGDDIGYTANGLRREAEFNMNTANNSGHFQYSDANRGWYKVDVSSVKVSGNSGWFAGKVTRASNPAWVGQWLFAKVQDGHPDMIWGSFTDQATATNGVASMATPADGPFNVTRGNIHVN